jgi:type II secretory ATPase GspE/PulE/Tfp pilus assembly ATPase PilB-like protein
MFTLTHNTEGQTIQYLDQLFQKAIQQAVTDIHFESYVSNLLIRFKKSGVFETVSTLNKYIAPLILSRIKVLAGLDINEHRIPQEGQLDIRTQEGVTLVLRISSIPTYSGETVAIRILDPRLLSRSLQNLGMPIDVYEAIKSTVTAPNGLIIISGPTGSGKTTTLYALLKELNTVKRKILTVEDPVEYLLEGILQVSVCPAIGLTFEHCLRSFLRQDPDVMAIGEIRDTETAKTAIQAALTGHLVISTIHTGTISETIGRLIQLGIEPYLLKACLRAVVQQALVYKPDNDQAAVTFELAEGEILINFIQQWDLRT